MINELYFVFLDVRQSLIVFENFHVLNVNRVGWPKGVDSVSCM
jgi:hypothetical protein